MSYSKRERGEYIRLKMHEYILLDLAHERITAIQAGEVYDLISFVETAGTTHNVVLAENKHYQKAVSAWVEAREINRQRFMKSKSL